MIKHYFFHCLFRLISSNFNVYNLRTVYESLKNDSFQTRVTEYESLCVFA